MKAKIKLALLFILILLCTAVLFSCNKQQSHTHSYSSEWLHDDTHHWHQATCSDGVECLYATYGLAEHSVVNGSCEICGFVPDSDITDEDDTNGDGNVTDSEGKNNSDDENDNVNDDTNDSVNDDKNDSVNDDVNDNIPCSHQYICEVLSNAGCTVDGENKFTCSLCQDSYTEVVSAFGHTEEAIPPTEPTCSQVGLIGGKHCTVCGEITEPQREINPLGHSYIEGVCTVCNEADPNYVPHDPDSIYATTTDNYCWVDVVRFTSNEGGEYTFHLPADLGAWSVDNNGRGPVVDSLHANYVSKECSFTVYIAPHSTYEFYIASSLIQDWIIKWSFEPCDPPIEGPENNDDLVDISGTYYGTDAFGNQLLTLVIDSSVGTVVFDYYHHLTGPNTINATYFINDGIVSLFDENGDALNPLSGTLTLVGNVPTYASYNATEYMLSTDPPGGDGSDSGLGEVTEIKGTMVDEVENSFVVTQQDLIYDKMYVEFTPVNSGVYDFISNHLFVNAIYRPNGNEAKKNKYELYVLDAQVTYTVEINLEFIAYGGNYTITPEYQYPSGHVKNPIWYTLGENTVANYTGNYQTVWYQFYADKTGKLTVTSTTPGVTIMIAAVINFDVSGEDTLSLDVVQGRKYYVGLVMFDSESEAEINFSASIDEGEITTDGSVNMPHIISLGNNSAEIGSSNGMYFIYKADKSGVITLSGGSGLSWGVVDFADQSHTTTESISTHLFAGDTVYFYIESDDVTETAEFNASFVEDAKQVYYGNAFVIDGSVENVFDIEENTYSYFYLAGITGKFIFLWDNPNATVTVSGTPINNGDTVNITSAWFGPYFEIYLEGYESGTVNLRIIPL